jgi:hypothetical protein
VWAHGGPLRTRTHAITFRLCNKEYQELVKAVSNRGARSVSEFTRSAVLNGIVAENLDQFLEEELNGLVSRLEAFDAQVRELRRHIRQLLTTADSGGARPVPQEAE